MTPTEELHAAATKLRETAAKATRGPWVYHPTIRRHEDTESAEYAWTICRPYCENDSSPCKPDCGADVLRTGAEDCDEDYVKVEDVQWMTLVNPLLADPLADALEGAAAAWDGCRAHQRLLAVARLINGGTR